MKLPHFDIVKGVHVTDETYESGYTPETVLKMLASQPKAEDYWKAFLAHLNEVRPLGKRGEDGDQHKSFIGTIDGYEKIFLEAARNLNKDPE